VNPKTTQNVKINHTLQRDWTEAMVAAPEQPPRWCSSGAVAVQRRCKWNEGLRAVEPSWWLLRKDKEVATPKQSRWNGNVAAVQWPYRHNRNAAVQWSCSKKKKMQGRPRKNLIHGAVAVQWRCNGGEAGMNGWGVVEEWKVCGGCSKKKKIVEGLRCCKKIWVFFNPTKRYCLG